MRQQGAIRELSWYFCRLQLQQAPLAILNCAAPSAVLERLIAQSDVLMHFRPGAMAAMGLDEAAG